MKIQQTRVQTKLSVRQHAEDLFSQDRGDAWLPIGRQSHHDVFVEVRFEPEIGRDRSIKLAQRVRKGNAIEDPNMMTVRLSEHRGVRFRGSINDEDCSTLKRRYQHGAGRVTEMMIQEYGSRTGSAVDDAGEGGP